MTPATRREDTHPPAELEAARARAASFSWGLRGARPRLGRLQGYRLAGPRPAGASERKCATVDHSAPSPKARGAAPHSAGVLAYRRSGGEVEVLLVHPGGPFWRSRDRGAWQIPKGLIDAGEAPEATARREFAEELGIALTGPLTLLGTVRQTGGKLVDAFATEEPIHIDQVVSNSFTMEWPPASGRMATFPEVDAARWFAMSEAREWILPSQAPFLEWLASLLSG